MNADVEISTDDRRLRPEASEVNRLFGDNSRLLELTGWQPSYGSLEGFSERFGDNRRMVQRSCNLSSYRPESYSI